LNDERLLQRVFGTLRIAGGTVQRQVLVEHFGKLVEVMLPDAKTSGPDVAPGRPPEGAAGRKRPKPLIAPFTAAQAATAQKAWADYLGKKVEEEVHVGGGVKMVFVLIPPGVYEMGSPASELTVNYYVKAQKDETPQHEVTISEPFYIGKFEVTQAEFGQIGTKKERNYFTATGYFKDRAEGIDTSRFPVETIKFEEADDFCKQFKVKAKLSPGWVKARLPSEAMWEYACRAGTTTRWNVGDRLTKAEANIGRDPGLPERDLDRTWEVGSGKANNFGLYDMHGNVWEWCSDLKKDYEAKNQVDPEIRDGKSPPAVRGGGFRDPPRRTRSATRYGDGPWFPSSDIGFRVVLVPAVPGK
jgi:formylglycine-generating enzyme required for sulfatase activity